jgi:hypothetical protein
VSDAENFITNGTAVLQDDPENYVGMANVKSAFIVQTTPHLFMYHSSYSVACHAARVERTGDQFLKVPLHL